MKSSILVLNVLIIGSIKAHAILLTITDPVEETVTFTLTQDVSFEMLETTFFASIVFEGWLPADNQAGTRNLTPNRVYYKINDGNLKSTGQATLYDYSSTQPNGIAPGDGVLLMQPLTFTAGDHITIVSQSWTMALSQAQVFGDIMTTFKGNAYIRQGTSGNVISTVSSVPEPATYTKIFGLSILLLAYFRRKYRNGTTA